MRILMLYSFVVFLELVAQVGEVESVSKIQSLDLGITSTVVLLQSRVECAIFRFQSSDDGALSLFVQVGSRHLLESCEGVCPGLPGRQENPRHYIFKYFSWDKEYWRTNIPFTNSTYEQELASNQGGLCLHIYFPSKERPSLAQSAFISRCCSCNGQGFSNQMTGIHEFCFWMRFRPCLSDIKTQKVSL